MTMSIAAALLFLGTLGILALGGWVSRYAFPSMALLPGVLLILIGVELRPRFGRVNRTLWTVNRADAPGLFALLDRTAEAAGVRPPQIVQVDTVFTASITVVGIRRRRVLLLGPPLWASLPPQQRVAVLGHEFGHFRNGDPRRGLLVQPAYRTLATLADLFRPYGRHEFRGPVGFLVNLVLGVLSGLALAGQIALTAIGQREVQRAEYLADEIAARVAGSVAIIGALKTALLKDVLVPSLARVARAGESGPAWLAAAEHSRAAMAGDLPARSQLSVRDEASLFADHPPTGLRIRMLEARPAYAAKAVLTEAEAARIDEELKPFYERCRRDLAHANF